MIIYTINIGGYDTINNLPNIQGQPFKGIYVTNKSYIYTSAKVKGWHVRRIDCNDVNKYKLLSRLYKIIPQLLFDESERKEHILYIDANRVKYIISSYELLLKTLNDSQEHKNFEILVSKHWRNKVFDEQKVIYESSLDTKSNVLNLRNMQVSKDFNDSCGLSQCNRILRFQLNNIKLLKLGGTWWRCYLLARRDQASFDYCIWKHNIKLSRSLDEGIFLDKAHETIIANKTRCYSCVNRAQLVVKNIYTNTDYTDKKVLSLSNLNKLSIESHIEECINIAIINSITEVKFILNKSPSTLIIYLVPECLSNYDEIINLCKNNIIEAIIVPKDLYEVIKEIKHYKGLIEIYDTENIQKIQKLVINQLISNPI